MTLAMSAFLSGRRQETAPTRGRSRPAGKRSYGAALFSSVSGGIERKAEGSQASDDAGGYIMNQGPIGGPMDFSDAGKQMHRLIFEPLPHLPQHYRGRIP